jgi:hypothetical protein
LFSEPVTVKVDVWEPEKVMLEFCSQEMAGPAVAVRVEPEVISNRTTLFLIVMGISVVMETPLKES